MKAPRFTQPIIRFFLASIGAVMGAFLAGGATLDVTVETRWAGEKVQMGKPYISPIDATARSIDRLDFLLSNFAVVRADGSFVPLTNSFAFMSLGQERDRVILTSVPDGEYRQLRFALGLSPEVNHADPSAYGPEHPLNPTLNGLHWSWQGGYIFMSLEGYWRLANGTNGGFSYHLGNDSSLRMIEVPIALRIKNSAKISLVLQLDRVFGGRRPVAAGEETASTHSRTNDALADQLLDNLVQAWDSTAVTTNTFVPQAVPRYTVVVASNAPLYRFQMPRSFPQPSLPRDNPLTVPGVSLGEALFNESGLSINGRQSCASCHQSSAGFVDAGKRFSRGAEGHEGNRNAMQLFNLAWQTNFFWDGRARSLREQVLAPIQNPVEMHATLDLVVTNLVQGGYATAFEAAFGNPEITSDRIARALEQYLLTLISGNSKFDRVQAGLEKPTEEEARGFQLFFTEYDPRHDQYGADCFHCHGGALFSDFGFHNNGLDLEANAADSGRSAITRRTSDRAKFKTPSLRNVAATGPYMHDGRFNSLEEVVAHYVQGVKRSDTLDPNLAKHPDGGVPLSREDQRALIAFLKTLTDDRFALPNRDSASVVPQP